MKYMSNGNQQLQEDDDSDFVSDSDMESDDSVDKELDS
eukprot:CAMPEP_0176402430 /NCGR_PEP_ID=MMETSP0126-20121128/49262_1 /TAXON_ID=141414 ORGANISM="Strombidinopsis acuminatum, Strain SPMC142" /NCGR_SAMPLE_ID=MMETSP0126 /ASSEMBLY_ACC=CAM_ASM_000229 /LENGTH=37 /DNA_ID= /DNA_START= /DNA_END= /DNA_ORIENTATION=